MTSAELQQLPLVRFNGTIHIVRGLEDWESVRTILPQRGVIGFDTESHPSFKKGQWFPPSLVQLATETDAILVQLSYIHEPYSILGEIFENQELLKVGVALRDDIRFLRRVFSFEPCGFAEIDPMAKKAELPFTGLRKLVAVLMGERLSKGAQVSDWSRNQLTDSQIHYAAADAWASLKVFKVLQKRYHVDPEPCIFQHLEDELVKRNSNRRRRKKPSDHKGEPKAKNRKQELAEERDSDNIQGTERNGTHS